MSEFDRFVAAPPGRFEGISRPYGAAEVERLLTRDRLDTEREVAPLRRAADAVLLDTTALDFEAQVEAVVRLAESRRR